VAGVDPAVTRALDLLRVFHAADESFADVRPAKAADVPEPFRTLLDHASHMTVAMERHHGGPVSLRVVQVADGDPDGRGYAREILLARGDGMVVQYGIVRLDFSAIDAATAAAIRVAEVPLGRLLIKAGLLREVHDVSLVEVTPGPGLGRLFGREVCQPTYGRVAEISIAGRPAIELLEVAAPPADK
jgi:chorismate-pyruvate lyase